MTVEKSFSANRKEHVTIRMGATMIKSVRARVRTRARMRMRVRVLGRRIFEIRCHRGK